MADVRMRLDEVRLCIKDAQLVLHGVRRNSGGEVIDHVDIALPWGFRDALVKPVNLDGINYPSFNDEAV